MKKVISLALFGDRGFDVEPVIASAYAMFPGWEIRVHVDQLAMVRYPWLAELPEVHLVECQPHAKKCRCMLWRLLPLWDPAVGIMISRDMDSLLMLKDRQMVEQFIRSGAACHCINDHPDHCVPMMGGMTGFNREAFWRLPGTSSYPAWEDFTEVNEGYWDQYGADQYLMADRFWPLVQRSLCEHRLAGWPQTPGAVYSSQVVEQLPLADVATEFFDRVPHASGNGECLRGDAYSNYVGAASFYREPALQAYRAWAKLPPALR